MKFDTIIFDMDGVVIDSEILYGAADAELFRRHGKVYSRQEVALMLVGTQFREGTEIIKAHYGIGADLDELVSQRRHLLEDQYRNNLFYVSGFEAFHKKITDLGFKSCIGTASDGDIIKIAEDRLKLSEKFGTKIYKVADVGNKSKPDPAIYLYCARQMSTEPSRCIVIEDAPKGVQAAKNAGMFCVGITTTFSADHLGLADLIIDKYEDLDLHRFR